MKEKVKSGACDTQERENKCMETSGRKILTKDPHVRRIYNDMGLSSCGLFQEHMTAVVNKVMINCGEFLG